MKLFRKSDEKVLYESELYRQVANEISSGKIHEGLWAKAQSKTRSTDIGSIQATYIKLRVQLLEAELSIAGQSDQEEENNRLLEGQFEADYIDSEEHERLLAKENKGLISDVFFVILSFVIFIVVVTIIAAISGGGV